MLAYALYPFFLNWGALLAVAASLAPCDVDTCCAVLAHVFFLAAVCEALVWATQDGDGWFNARSAFAAAAATAMFMARRQVEHHSGWPDKTLALFRPAPPPSSTAGG